MNIGIFTDTYFPEISGVATSVKILSDQLRKRGHKVYIFTISNPLNDQKDIGIIRLPSIPFIFFKSRRVGVFYVPKVFKLIKKLKLDIIHTQTEFSLGILGKMAAKRLEIPIVHTYHTIYKDYAHYISKGKFKHTSDNIIRLCSKNFCNNTFARIITPTIKVFNLLKDYSVTRPMQIVPTGVKINKFNKRNFTENELLKLKESLEIASDDLVVLYLGRVAKEKSIDVIIKQMPKVLETIKNCKLLIVGDGPITSELIDLSKELQIDKSVIFAGEQPWEEIEKFYRLGHVFVSASTTESQGLTIIEAMASNIPIIVKQDENLNSLVQDRFNGLIFKSDNELPSVLIEALKNKDLCETIKNNAITTVEEYSAEKFGEKIENLYFDVLENQLKEYVTLE